MKVRREMFGSAGAEERLAAATDFTRPLEEMVTQFCFGEVWTRAPLDRKTRSMLTIAVLMAIGRPNQLKVHVRGGLQNGVTKEEIREILLHTMAYTGIPSAVDAFNAAAEILEPGGAK